MVWTLRIPGRPTFSPVVVDEKMVLTTGAHSEIVGSDPIQENCVICVNKYTGERYWKFEGEGKMNCAPCVADNTVYASSSEGMLYAIDLERGDLLWEYETGTSLYLAKTPMVYEDRVYFVCDTLYCLDLNGTVLWKSPLQFNQKVWASNHRLYTIEDDDAVGVDIETGEILWRVPIDNYFFTTSLQGWNHLFFGSEGTAYCVSRDGEVLWEYTIQEHDDFFIYSTPVLYDGYVVMGTQLGHVYTFRLPGEWCYQEAEAMYEDGHYDIARGFYSQALNYYQQRGENPTVDHITQRLAEIGPEPDTCLGWRAYEVREESSLYSGLGIWVGVMVGIFMWMKVFRNI
jgi:outer membrane protein assembly factor BamB